MQLIKDNKIEASTFHQHDRTIKQMKQHVQDVSLTRDIRFAMRWGARKGYNDYVILELNQPKLIQKYNHFQDDEFTYKGEGRTRQMNDVMFGGFPVNQYEENVIGSITPLDKYLVRVHLAPSLGKGSSEIVKSITPSGIEVTDKLTKKQNVV